MKKSALIASAAALLFTATVNAQTDTVPSQPSTNPVATEAPVKKDRWNNWDSTTYKMQPMPEALTTEKIFPVIGRYELTAKDGTASTVTVSLDETNKGLVWVDGLPQGRIKATLRKSPAIYKIPAQKLGEEKDAKSVAEGVMIYDKDANVLNVCIGCEYNNDDPAMVFASATTDDAAAQTEEKKVTKTKVNGTKTKTKTKVAKAKPVHYTGSKVIETTAVAQPLQ